MKDVLVMCKTRKCGISYNALLSVLALAVIAGLGAAANAGAAASPNKRLLLSELSLFDPFTLETIGVSTVQRGDDTEADSGPILMLSTSTLSRPPIRIPYRPPLRSPFRPPL